MAQSISVNVYSLDAQTNGFPKRMVIPTQGFTALAYSGSVGAVQVYSSIRILATNQLAYTVETPAALATLANA